MSLAAFVRRFKPRRLVRTWGLCAPVVTLAICIPLLLPLRSHDPSQLNDDQQANLATIQAIVERQSLAIEETDFCTTRSKIHAVTDPGGRLGHRYSDQPPMLAVMASGPYWILHRAGLTFGRYPNLILVLLTFLVVTLPVALSAGLVYRMGRIFELTRPLRAVLALTVVIASGLISYSTVLNAHAPAAALLLAAAACLIHVITHQSPQRAALWLLLAGFCAALAATLDPPALAFLLLFILVILALHWRVSNRLAGVLIYALAAAGPVFVHAHLTRPITGDLRAGIFHPELGMARAQLNPQNQLNQPTDLATTPSAAAAAGAASDLSSVTSISSERDEDDEPQTGWQSFLVGCYHILGAFVGRHGIFSHFPVVLLGIIGVTLIMHRHWPAPTKMLAGTTLGAALAVILAYALCRSGTRNTMFATRWFVVCLPLTLFWAGAWLRRGHRQGSWIMAGTALAFSVIVSLIGATGPLPRDGFDRYTVAGALRNLARRAEPPASHPLPVVDRGSEDARAE